MKRGELQEESIRIRLKRTQRIRDKWYNVMVGELEQRVAASKGKIANIRRENKTILENSAE